MSFPSESDGSRKKESKGDKPLLVNRGEGAAAWLNKDKKGNAYITVNLPLGLGHLSLFPRDEFERESMNKLREHVEANRPE